MTFPYDSARLSSGPTPPPVPAKGRCGYRGRPRPVVHKTQAGSPPLVCTGNQLTKKKEEAGGAQLPWTLHTAGAVSSCQPVHSSGPPATVLLGACEALIIAAAGVLTPDSTVVSQSIRIYNPRSKPGTGRGKISSHFTNEEAGLPGGRDFGGLIEKGDSAPVPDSGLLGPSPRVRALSGRRALPSWDGG